MSAFDRIKLRVKAAQQQQQKGGGGGGGLTPSGPVDRGEVVVLPPKPTKRRKLLEVQKEAKVSLDRGMGGGSNTQVHHPGAPSKPEDELDDEEVMEDADGKENKPIHIPWGPSELLNHLDKPAVVANIERVIQLVKQKEKESSITEEDRKNGVSGLNGKKKEVIVWDHSKTKHGKESDNNFFLWLEAYAAVEDKLCQEQENMIFG